MTSSVEQPRTDARPAQQAAARIATLLVIATACSGDGPVTPPSEAPCDGVSQQVVSLGRYETTVLTGNAVHCTVLGGAGASYLIMPQLTSSTLPYGGFGFRIGDPEATPPVALIDAPGLADAELQDPAASAGVQSRLDGLLRARERQMRTRPQPHATLRADQPPPARALDPVRRFSVLSTLAATPAWATADAALRFEGDRIAIYVDTVAATAFSGPELLAMGELYDDVLAARAFESFGPASDLDGNGKVIFLLTPIVNAMIPAQQCAVSGFVRGFFYGHDLSSQAPTSNQGEVMFGYVPDPTGRWSCAHGTSTVLANLAPTFIHELQHLISFGAHTIVRGGASEETWLNEGLSHYAEELGARYWEARFPAPSGRSDPNSIFPDSASPYINPNLLYSYRFLLGSGSYSLLACAPGSFCTQSERGGAWLFLRWIADQKGESTVRALVQSPLTGRANLEAVTGESAAALLGDFAIAVSADSLEGVARTRVASRYRFGSRNFRAIYRRLFESFGLAGGVPRPFPIIATDLASGTVRTGTMRPGTFITYRLTTEGSAPTARLRFSVPDGSAFPAGSGAQISVLRIE